MAAGIPTRLSPAEGRRFGLTVGAAFTALAGVAGWRGHQLEARWLAGVAGALVAGGLLVPMRLGVVHGAWMALGKAISKVTTPVFMGIVYFAAVTPIGILRRLAGHNRLARPRGSTTYWISRASKTAARSDMERQF